MRNGEQIKLPCGATVTVRTLEARSKELGGLASLQVDASNIALRATVNGVTRSVDTVILNFFGKNIPTLITILQDTQAELDKLCFDRTA